MTWMWTLVLDGAAAADAAAAPPADLVEVPRPGPYRIGTAAASAGVVAAVPLTLWAIAETYCVLGCGRGAGWLVAVPVTFGLANAVAVTTVPTARAVRMRRAGVPVTTIPGRVAQGLAIGGLALGGIGWIGWQDDEPGTYLEAIGGVAIGTGLVLAWAQGAANEAFDVRHRGETRDAPAWGIAPVPGPGGPRLIGTVTVRDPGFR